MGSLSPQYLAEVARRREAAAAKAAAACSTDGMWSARASASAAPFVLDTRDAAELTAAEVRSEFLAKFRPLVVTGATASSWVSPEGASTEGEAEAPWTLDWLVAHVGSKQVAVNVAGSQTTSCTEGVDVMPFRELAARLRAGEVLYLYDMSIPLKLPTLTEHLGVPAMYAHDWMQRTRELHAFSRSWPSLFVGAPGTRSSLHTDQWRGHFWMAQIQGTKRWTIFHPDDAWCLEPSWPESEPHLEPRFPDLDAMQALHLAASPHSSVHLPTSPNISLHLPIAPHTSPYLPTSPHISPYLRISRHLSAYPSSTHCRQSRAATRTSASRGGSTCSARPMTTSPVARATTTSSGRLEIGLGLGLANPKPNPYPSRSCHYYELGQVRS